MLTSTQKDRIWECEYSKCLSTPDSKHFGPDFLFWVLDFPEIFSPTFVIYLDECARPAGAGGRSQRAEQR